MNNMRRHPASQAELLLHADGELCGEASNRLDSHLADCADCRAELEDRESVLGIFARLRDTLGIAMVSPPPNHWEPLDTRIDAWESGRSIGSLIDRLHGVARLRYALAGTLALMLVLAAVFLRTWQTVSANELLNHARVAQGLSLGIVPWPVTHETLRIARRSAMRGEDTVINYESWQDTSGKIFRENSSSGAIVTELQRVYQANGLDWKSPLSAAAYERWRSSLVEKQDSVTHTGRGRLTLTTVAGVQAREDAISKSQLVVRATDWRPVVMRLWLLDLEYEITEVSFDAPPLSQLPPSFSEAPASPHAAPAPEISAGKVHVSAARTVGRAASGSPVDLLPVMVTVKSVSSVTPRIASSSDTPRPLENISSGDFTDSTAETANHAPFIPETAALPSAPAPHLPVTMTFATRSSNLQRLPPQSKSPVVRAPTAFPLGPLQEQRNPPVDNKALKALASKLGLIKKKSPPLEPAEPGG